MSDSVSSFQSQVASVLDSLVKVAAEEICKLFDTSYGGRSSISSEKAGSNIKLQYCVDADKPHSAKLRTKPECDLKKIGRRNIRSVGVQVGECFTAAQLWAEERGVVFWEGCDSEKPLAHRGRGSSALVKQERTEDVAQISVPQGGLQIAPEGSDALPGSVQLALVERQLGEEVWGSSLDQSHSKPTLAEDPQVQELQPVCEEPPEERAEQDPDGDDLLKTESVCDLHALGLMEVVCQEKSTDAEKAKSDLISLPGGSWEVESSPVQAREGSSRDASSGCEMQMKAVWSFPRRQPCVSSSPDTKLLLPCSVLLVNMLHSTAPGKRRKAQRAKGFTTPKDLRTHQRLHTGKRLCCFKQCENGVWRLQSVLTQGQSHDCKLCGKKFKRRKILRRHERFHLGERPYVCTECQKTFVQRKSLRRHERFHTGERPHCCTHCGKSFRLKENLKSHLRFHTGERPYACTWCKKQFRILRNLERHKNACGSGASSFCRNQLQTKELAVD